MSFGSSNDKGSTIELIGKLIIGLIIAGFLAGIFAVLVARLPESNNNNNVRFFEEFLTDIFSLDRMKKNC